MSNAEKARARYLEETAHTVYGYDPDSGLVGLLCVEGATCGNALELFHLHSDPVTFGGAGQLAGGHSVSLPTVSYLARRDSEILPNGSRLEPSDFAGLEAVARRSESVVRRVWGWLTVGHAPLRLLARALAAVAADTQPLLAPRPLRLDSADGSGSVIVEQGGGADLRGALSAVWERAIEGAPRSLVRRDVSALVRTFPVPPALASLQVPLVDWLLGWRDELLPEASTALEIWLRAEISMAGHITATGGADAARQGPGALRLPSGLCVGRDGTAARLREYLAYAVGTNPLLLDQRQNGQARDVRSRWVLIAEAWEGACALDEVARSYLANLPEDRRPSGLTERSLRSHWDAARSSFLDRKDVGAHPSGPGT